MLSPDRLAKTYTPLEYTHNLHDTLSVKIAAANDEVKNFEGTVRTMISELQSGGDSKEVRVCGKRVYATSACIVDTFGRHVAVFNAMNISSFPTRFARRSTWASSRAPWTRSG